VIVAAAAALTGLLFVAVSINLAHILKIGRFLPARAAEPVQPAAPEPQRSRAVDRLPDGQHRPGHRSLHHRRGLAGR
jgi:hypothetical protein